AEDGIRDLTVTGVQTCALPILYLNAGVFTKDGAAGGINASGYNSCSGIIVSGGQDACQAALAMSDSLLNSGTYRLADSFPQNFRSEERRVGKACWTRGDTNQ